MIKRIIERAKPAYVRQKSNRYIRRDSQTVLPPTIILVGTADSGLYKLADSLGRHAGIKVHHPAFLSGLHTWYPTMNKQAGKPIEKSGNGSSARYVRNLLRDLLADEKINILTLDVLQDIEQYPTIIDTLDRLFVNARILYIFNNPLVEIQGNLSAVEVVTYAYRWREAARLFLDYGRRSPDRVFYLSFNPNWSSNFRPRRDNELLLMKMAFRDHHTVIRWQSLEEIGNSTDGLAQFFSLESPLSTAEFILKSPVSLDTDTQNTVIQILGYEMLIFRSIGVGEYISARGLEPHGK
ncbi:MAG: hypothetical protein JXA10_20250 [Anaerolineae bacterium]|nr:hypothetical protein [Anaerolineae bacterium]